MIECENGAICSPKFWIYGNSIINLGSSAGGSSGIRVSEEAGSMAGGYFDIHNNSVYALNASGARFNVDDANILDLKNNSFFSNGDNYAFLNFNDGAINSHSNNLYYKTGSYAWVKDGSTDYSNASAVQGWEASSKVTNPTYTINISNLHPQTGSPLIDGGTTISGYILDIEGITVGSPPNIGAYETIEDP